MISESLVHDGWAKSFNQSSGKTSKDTRNFQGFIVGSFAGPDIEGDKKGQRREDRVSFSEKGDQGEGEQVLNQRISISSISSV